MNQTKSEYDLLISCPVCNEGVMISVEDVSSIRDAKRYPVSLTNVHGDPKHAITLFIDQDMRVRAVEPSDIIFELEELKANRTLRERYIPYPIEGHVDLGGLSREEVVIISLSDGNRDITEICKVLTLSKLKGKMFAEKLVRDKKLAKVEKKII